MKRKKNKLKLKRNIRNKTEIKIEEWRERDGEKCGGKARVDGSQYCKQMMLETQARAKSTHRQKGN